MTVLQLYRVDLSRSSHVSLPEHGRFGCLHAPPPGRRGGSRNPPGADAWRFPYRLREEGMLLEAATNDGLAVQTQPLIDQRGIGATEIVVVVQVAIEQFLRR